MLLSMYYYYIAPSSNTQLHRTLTRRSHGGNIFTLADDLPIWDCVYSEGHSHAKKKTAFHASNGWVPLLHTPPESCLVLLLLAAAAVLGQISSLKPKDLKIAANVLLLLKMYLLTFLLIWNIIFTDGWIQKSRCILYLNFWIL